MFCASLWSGSPYLFEPPPAHSPEICGADTEPDEAEMVAILGWASYRRSLNRGEQGSYCRRSTESSGFVTQVIQGLFEASLEERLNCIS